MKIMKGGSISHLAAVICGLTTMGFLFALRGMIPPTLLQLKRVVGSHLERFTQNELVSLDWMDELESKHGGLK